jgi:hypothetical protein
MNLRTIAIIILACLVMSACNFPRPGMTPTPDGVATQLSKILTEQPTSAQEKPVEISTQTPPDLIITNTPIPSTDTPTPTFTVTPTLVDPRENLGDPTWSNALDNGKGFGLPASGFSDKYTTVRIENGAMYMSSSSDSGWRGWRLSSRKPKDFYMETSFITMECVGPDVYGLVVRALNYTSGYGYYYGLTCNGEYTFSRWDGSGTTTIVEPTKDDVIKFGANQVNLMGILAQGNTFKLYANGKFLKEVTDYGFAAGGYIGVYVAGYGAQYFSVALDNIAYWDTP